MSLRASLPALALVAALAILSCFSASVWGSFTASTVSPGNSIVAAADWVAPQTTMLNPGSPLRATVSLGATATDAGGVSTVTIERSATGTGVWVAVCTDGLAPYNCALDTTLLADGSYDLRAVARDTAGNSRTSITVAARIVDNNGPTVTLAPTASDVRGVITLTATATDAGTGMASVRFERSLADADTWSTVCTDASSPYSCSLDTASLANDIYDFRAVALDLAGNTTTSVLVADVQVDNAVPFGVAVTAPASPLRGAVTLTATAQDDDSGVATVTLQRRTGAGAFVDICTTSSDPFSCLLITTAGATPDGTYDLRAVAVDGAGNTTTSATVTRQIDNSQPSVSLVDPGAYLRGTVTVQANAFAGSGVTSVAIQRAPAGGTTFTTICSDNLAPFTCNFVTTGVTDGLYDLRAVMTYASGQTLTSALVTDRRVDNSVVTGYDVQAENGVGGRAGRVETGDVVVVTWSRKMNTTTLLPAWSGTGAANLVVRLVDGSLVGTGGAADGLQLLDGSGSGSGLGSVNLKASLIKAKKTTAFTATATQSTVTIGGIDRTVVRITLVSVTSGSGNVRTSSTSPVMVWTPSASARDLTGVASSAAPISELGLADRDF